MASKKVKYFGIFNRSILVMIFDDFVKNWVLLHSTRGLSKLYCDSPRIARGEGFTSENLNGGKIVRTLSGFVVTKGRKEHPQRFLKSLEGRMT